jgi:NADH-quinone oxidoreductase subunit N
MKGPHIDWAAISPLVALTVGACLVLMAGLLRPAFVRRTLVPGMTIAALGAAAGLGVWQWDENVTVVSDALAVDNLTLALLMIFVAGALATVLLSARSLAAAEAGHGEYYALLLTAVLGMTVLAGATNLVTLFIGFELLSIPLYVMCATELRREHSLESGLKYLIIGSLGSAVLLYGLALLYGATGSTDFAAIADAAGDVQDDALFVTALALIVTGLAFKASVAPFHQWTPDVYEGAPTSVTAFMAVATKTAAFGVLLRLFDVALLPAKDDWDVALAALAVATIAIGNIGAIGQVSLKRLLAYSGVAQAGYMLAGVLVATQTGVKSVVFYLFVYLIMNMAAFAVVIARERESGLGDHIDAVAGIGATRPALAWPLTISMLGLAGLPGTAGFLGKFFLIEASVDGDFTWLGVAIVVGSMLSLVYYLRVVAAVWMQEGVAAVPAMAGGSPEAGSVAPPTRSAVVPVAIAVLAGAATVVFGILPGPLLDLASDAGAALL